MSKYVIRRFLSCLALPLILVALTAGCGGRSTRQTPAPTTSAQPPTIQTLPSGQQPEKLIITTETIPQNNCGGTADVSNEVSRSRSIAYILDVGVGVTVSASGTLGIPGVGSVQAGTEVAAQYGVTYGREETLTRSLTVSAKEGTNMRHTIQQVEYWETGEFVIVIGGQSQKYPYKFRKDFGMELVISENLGCPTPRTPAPSPIPTLTPAPTPTPTPFPPTPPLWDVFPQATYGEAMDFRNKGGVLTAEFVKSETCNHSGQYGLRITYDMSGDGNGGWATHWDKAPENRFDVELSESSALVFWVQGAKGGETFQIGLKDTAGNEVKLESKPYVVVEQGQWSRVYILLRMFKDSSVRVNVASIQNLNFGFNNTHGSGIVCIDDIVFEN